MSRCWIEALLTGAPPCSSMSTRRCGVRCCRRTVASVDGRGSCDVDSDERCRRLDSFTRWILRARRSALADRRGARSWMSSALQPGGSEAPTEIWADPVEAAIPPPRGPLARQPAGAAALGAPAARLEQREEAMQFNATVGRVERNVRGGYAQLALPLVDADRRMFGVEGLTAYAGLRRDVSCADVAPITRTHLELEWKLNDHLSVDANLAQQY